MSALAPGRPGHLYVHVPFCRAKCEYCGFFSAPAAPDAGVLDEYVEAATAEWRSAQARYGTRRLRTVFLGGGTPSLLGPARLERLLAPFDRVRTRHAEVTVETNPEDVDEEYARWADGRGIRMSLGVQSFAAATRRALGRSTEADPVAAYERLRRAGCREVGLDLIFGAPGQSLAGLEEDLARVVDLRPEHVSWYELELVEGTPLAGRAVDAEGGQHVNGDGDEYVNAEGDEHVEAGAAGADADERAEMYRRIVRWLGRAGYDWYEVSNFALPGHRCRHNSAIWRGEDYVGLGPGAVGTVGGVRRQNLPDLDGYLAALRVDDGVAVSEVDEAAAVSGVDERGSRGAATVDPPHSIERLDACTRMRERVYLASRIGAPVALAEVNSVVDEEAVTRLAEAGLVTVGGGKLRVTRKGRYVADEVCVRLFRDFCVEGQD